MELWQLRTFNAVAKNLHFTIAAEELNLSQPAVSHQIKSLEDEIGEPLFLRDKEGILLTKAGHTMYQHATKILDIADEIRLEIKENTDDLSGTIIISVATRGLGSPFPLFYKDFKKTYRDIELFVQNEYMMDEVVEKIRNGSADLGLVSHNVDLSGLVAIPYGEYELILVVGRNHPFAELEEVNPEDLQNQKWVSFEPANRIRVSTGDYLSKIGIKAKNIYETNDGALVRSMVEHTNKISLLPEWGVFEEIREGRLIKVNVKNIKYKIQVNLIWKANRRTKLMSAVINYFLGEKMEGIDLSKVRK